MFKIFIRETISLLAGALFIILVIGYASGALGAASVFCPQTMGCTGESISSCDLPYPFVELRPDCGSRVARGAYYLVYVTEMGTTGLGASCEYVTGNPHSPTGVITLFDITHLLMADYSVKGNKWIRYNWRNLCYGDGRNEINTSLCPLKSVMNNRKS